MEKNWSRTDKLTVGGLIFAAVAAIAAVLVVPEFRQFFHLDKPEMTQAETKPTQTVSPSTPPVQNTEPRKPEASKTNNKPTQKTTHVGGNDNVAGNDISGDRNVTGNSNQTGPTAIAPNGIAIAGGTVNNPTVNNFGKPSRHLTESQKKTLIASLKGIDSQSFYFLSASDAESTHFGEEVLKMLTSPELGWKELPLPSN